MRTRTEQLRIAGRCIGPGEPCYVIAEAGVNHNGDLKLAKRLVDAAQRAGVDAVKFQKRKLNEVYQQAILDEPRRGEQGLQYIVPLLLEFELSDDEFAELADYSRKQGVVFFCTPWDRSSVDLLEEIGVPAYKVGSPDMTNFPLIEYIAGTGKPLLISTGMSSEDEIRRTIAFLKTLNIQCGVFHCVSTYPVAPDEINLRFMQKLQDWCPWPVGYSGHEDSIAISASAVAMGASLLERHITLDRRMRGPDHQASLEPDGFCDLVKAVRDVEAALGVAHRWISRGEVLNRRLLAKSLVAAADVAAGTVITADLIGCKSPGLGISPQRIDQLVGRRVTRDLRQDEVFRESDFEHEVEDARGRRMIDLGIDWGVVARFTDVDALVERFAPQGMSVVELHLSDRDLDAGMSGFDAKPYPLQLVIHAPEYCHDQLIDLCAVDGAQRDLSIRRIQKTVDLARELAKWFACRPASEPKIVVHVGGMSLHGKAYDREAAAERLLASLRMLHTEGVDLLLENLPPCPWYFGGRWTGHMLVDGPTTRRLCEESGFGLCFDTSHAALTCHHSGELLADFACLVLPYTRHLHIADGAGISGEGLQIGDGQVDFVGLWPGLVRTRATCVPEIWQGHHDTGSGFQIALDRLTQVAWCARALSAVQHDTTRSDLSKLIVPIGSSVAAALRSIEANALGIVVVVDDDGAVVGIATDGDVRRALLCGCTLHNDITDAMNRDFEFVFDDASQADIAARLSTRCRLLPILNSGRRFVSYASLSALTEGATVREVAHE